MADHTTVRRRSLIKGIALAVGTLSTPLISTLSAAAGTEQAAGATYPNRPVKLIVPFAPGGASDALARIISSKLSETMGQTWIVENRGGAGGNLAAERSANAAPDGYTVFLGLNTIQAVNPTLYKLSFNMAERLEAVTMLATADHILIVHPSVPANTLEEFIALAKQKPGYFSYASAGVGSSLHLAMELFMKRVGIEMVHVPFKGGGPAAAAVLSGQPQVMLGTISSTISYLKAGRIRPLANTATKRASLLPDVPTVAESGYPGFEFIAWFAFLVPSGTPKAIMQRIRGESIKALKDPGVQTAMARLGLEPESSTSEELAARIKMETIMWSRVIKDANIRLVDGND